MTTAIYARNSDKEPPTIRWIFRLVYSLWVLAIVVCLTGFVKACTEQGVSHVC